MNDILITPTQFIIIFIVALLFLAAYTYFIRKDPSNKAIVIDKESRSRTIEPIVLIIENHSATDQKAVLFGQAENEGEINYGSDPGIEIKPAIEHLTYGGVLRETVFKPGRTTMLRFSTKNEQFFEETTLLVAAKHSSGEMATTPISLKPYLTPEQKKENKTTPNKILDVPTNIMYNAYTSWSFKMSPNSKVILSIYLSEQMNIKGDVVKYLEPQLKKFINTGK